MILNRNTSTIRFQDGSQSYLTILQDKHMGQVDPGTDLPIYGQIPYMVKSFFDKGPQ